MLVGFLGWIPHAYNPACIDYAHIGLFMRAHDPARNRNPNFSDSISYLTCNASILDYIYIYSFESLMCMKYIQ